jgi:Arc/MetJ family transcription regulator
MRTNIEIDDKLLKEAMKAAGQTTKRATVEEALRRVIKLDRQRQAGRNLAGIDRALPQRHVALLRSLSGSPCVPCRS